MNHPTNGVDRSSIGDTSAEITSYFNRLFEPDPDAYPVDRYYFDDRCQLDYSLWRLDRGFTRYYYDPEANTFHASVTSIISDQEPNKPFLNQWQSNMGGYDEAQYFKETRADYGSLMHILINEVPRVGAIPTEHLLHAVRIFVRKNEIWFRDTRYWHDDLKNDLASLYQWWHEYNVVPLASEIPIKFPIYNSDTGELIYVVGGTPDLVCEMDAKNYKKTPKSKRQRIKVLVDFKSGRKGFYESHKIQREVYLEGWNHNMRNHIPDGRSTRSFVCTHHANWAPTASRGAKQTYKFDIKEGTSVLTKKFENWVRNFVNDGKNEVRSVRRITGTLQLGQDTSKNVVYEDAGKFMHRRWEEAEEERQQKEQQKHEEHVESTNQ